MALTTDNLEAFMLPHKTSLRDPFLWSFSVRLNPWSGARGDRGRTDIAQLPLANYEIEVPRRLLVSLSPRVKGAMAMVG